MKIVLICSGLEKGKDGVGDYTRKLSAALKLSNIEPLIIAFNDKHIHAATTEVSAEGISIYRLPSSYSIQEKEAQTRAIIQANLPVDWISIQFVSYGLNTKGIVKNLIPVFKRIVAGYKVHLMFHELWVAEEKQASLKMKVLGRVQKRYILSFIKNVNPAIVNTSMPLYQTMLKRSGVNASILPLFSNIEYNPGDINDFKNEIPPDILHKRAEYVIGCVFGSIYHNSWDMDTLLIKLSAKCAESGKKALIVSIGKISQGKEFWDNLASRYPDIGFLTLGPRSEKFISNWLAYFVDLGIITTPALIAGKSGSYMAFLEHGLPVYCKKNELSFSFNITQNLIDERLVEVDRNFKFDLLPRLQPMSQIKHASKIFVESLNHFN